LRKGPGEFEGELGDTEADSAFECCPFLVLRRYSFRRGAEASSDEDESSPWHPPSAIWTDEENNSRAMCENLFCESLYGSGSGSRFNKW